ncbi:33 kDa [Spodoptera frugiperda ascovirus 1a]|uniref:33 kDa n=1 Tax=Spodoptera frugiperda ascovirus 1a TaxID=113370 RepID=Q0E4Y3_SFAVA|nr:33 kDa [Spodoptera frugiperda ascovirus 1a]CAL44718.1 33 kDa [Spodoptera frugiperda ascovirus 1a]
MTVWNLCSSCTFSTSQPDTKRAQHAFGAHTSKRLNAHVQTPPHVILDAVAQRERVPDPVRQQSHIATLVVLSQSSQQIAFRIPVRVRLHVERGTVVHQHDGVTYGRTGIPEPTQYIVDGHVVDRVLGPAEIVGILKVHATGGVRCRCAVTARILDDVYLKVAGFVVDGQLQQSPLAGAERVHVGVERLHRTGTKSETCNGRGHVLIVIVDRQARRSHEFQHLQQRHLCTFQNLVDDVTSRVDVELALTPAEHCFVTSMIRFDTGYKWSGHCGKYDSQSERKEKSTRIISTSQHSKQ